MNRKFVGLKGIACLVVFISHFICAFLPGIKFSETTVSYLGGKDIAIGKMLWYPFKFLGGGDGAVILFIVLSCYFIMNSLLKSDTFLEKAGDISLKRYPRLVLPIMFSCLLVWLFSKIGILYSQGFDGIVGYDWLDRQYSTPYSIIKVLFISLIKVPSVGDNSINTVLWMMHYIFIGTFIAIIFALIIKQIGKTSIIPIAIIGMLLALRDYYNVCYLIAAFVIWFEKFVHIKKSKLFGIVSLILSFIFLNFSSYATPEIGILATRWKLIVIVLFGCGVACLLIGFILINNAKGLAFKPFEFLDKISFSICLVHMPIIMSLSCILIRTGIKFNINYGPLCIGVFVISLCVVIIGSYLFYRFIETNCNKITVKLCAFLKR